MKINTDPDLKVRMIPEPGDEVYVGSSFYIGHGEDDFLGGIATIERVVLTKECPNSSNRIFVVLKENPGSQHNWTMMEREQKRLKTAYGSQRARPDPDFHDYGERW